MLNSFLWFDGLAPRFRIEIKYVRALWQFDNERVTRSFDRVILRQFHAPASCLHANGRVQVGIEIRRTSEHLGGNLILLERSTRVFNCVLGKITKQFTERFGAMQSFALNELINFGRNFWSI